MKLKDHLVERDGRLGRVGAEVRRIAKRAGTTPQQVYLLARGDKSPSLSMAQRIERATGGRVGVGDWPLRKAA